MSLKQLTITNVKPSEKPYKLFDSNGLHLLVKPNGSKLWRLKYRFYGKEKLLSIGAFPQVSIIEAREKATDARKLLAQGVDPSQHKKASKLAATVASANTFAAISEEYISKRRAEGLTEVTLEKKRWLLLDLASPLANRPIAEITAAEILDVLRRLERNGRRESAHRLRGTIGAVFRFAIATVRAATDPTFALRGALPKVNVVHRAAITDEKKFGTLMASINDYDGWPTLKAALQILALTMTRPGEVRHMKRAEIDLDRAVWRIPAERMKMRRPHDVPLSRQAVAVLQDALQLSTGDLVLPSIRSNRKPLSENAMNSALRRMGYTKDEVTAHGFRSSASTILNERGFNPQVIEAALAHQDANEVRRTYNRAQYWPERVKLLQAWADLLDEFQGLRPRLRVVA